jgi:hypothetical protein
MATGRAAVLAGAIGPGDVMAVVELGDPVPHVRRIAQSLAASLTSEVHGQFT